MIDQDHKQKFINVWERGDYRRGSTAQRLVQRLLGWIPEYASINDYGCGTGRAEVEICKVRPFQKITMIDITETAVEDGARAIIQNSPYVSFIEADLADLGEIPKADWGMCINCLMTVQADKLQTILNEIKRTCENCIIEVYDWSDVRLGVEMTTVKMSKDEWRKELLTFWPKVSYFPDYGNDRRSIYICEGS